MGWNDERVEDCVRLWHEGFSASEIARRLGGVSRNAVIGKIHRLGLSHTVTQRKPKVRKPVERRPRTAKAPRAGKPMRWGNSKSSVPVEPEPLPAEPARPDRLFTLAELEDNQCRFIYGDPKADHGFCGVEKQVGSSYCPGHHALCTAAPEPRQRKVKPFLAKQLEAVEEFVA